MTESTVKKMSCDEEKDLVIKALTIHGVLREKKMANATKEQRNQILKDFYERLQDVIATWGFQLQDEPANQGSYVVIEKIADGNKNGLAFLLVDRFTQMPLSQEGRDFIDNIINSLRYIVENGGDISGKYGKLVVHDDKLVVHVKKAEVSDFILPEGWTKAESVPLSLDLTALLEKHQK